MMTHKERMLAAFRGEEVDRLPFVPRLELWYLANSTSGTLPKQHAGRTMNEIARAEGWAVYFRFADNQLSPEDQPKYLHRGIGLFGSRDTPYDFILPRDVEVKVYREGGYHRVEYHTPLGMISTTSQYDIETQKLGITVPALVNHLIKTPDDYAPAGYLFENIRAVASYDRYLRWSRDEIRDDGVAVAMGFPATSPMHEIQRDLIEPTQFFLHYGDHHEKVRRLADQMEPLFNTMLDILCESPAPVALWGSNYDDMLTYPPYFEREIQPWIRKVSGRLAAAGKLMLCHTDGENEGLMDLIRDSGMHIAESICPAPMTRVPLAEYYRRWSPHLTLFGGIPSTIVLPETSDAEFESYMDELFRAVAPGKRMLVGIADMVPPDAIFSRLQRIHERIEREGALPLKVFAAGAAGASPAKPRADDQAAAALPDDIFTELCEDVLKGRHLVIKDHVNALLERGVPADEILDNGLIAAMAIIGRRMATGEAFIPEVLLAARAMTAAVSVLEARLAASGHKQRGKVVIGTVSGDFHDIGKNLVTMVLKGVGFEVIDLGVNVSHEKFCEAVVEHKPNVLCLSALLTTTMMEMPRVLKMLEDQGLRSRCKVVVGGAPVTEHFAKQIGADAYAPNAVDAVNTIRRFPTAPAAS
jgi:methylmalonyl-CoA mutase cobalamin-binding domain/chain